jgi:hypothetical protein
MNKLFQRALVILLLASPILLAVLFWKTATSAYRPNTVPLGESFKYDITSLRKVDPKLVIGVERDPIPVSIADPVALALGPDGLIAVAGANQVALITGAVTKTFSIAKPATCIAVDTHGGIFVGHKDRVTHYAMDGALVAEWSPVGNTPIITSIGVEGDNVYVADAGNKILHQYNRAGRLQRALCGKNADHNFPGLLIPTPYLDIAISPEGELWVVDPGRHALLHVDTTDGHVLSSWEKNSMDIEGFVGCSNPTHIALMPGRMFVTSEKGVPRIKLYAITGTLLGVIAAPGLFGEDTKGLDLAVDAHNRVIVLDPEKKQVRVFTVQHESITPST